MSKTIVKTISGKLKVKNKEHGHRVTLTIVPIIAPATPPTAAPIGPATNIPVPAPIASPTAAPFIALPSLLSFPPPLFCY